MRFAAVCAFLAGLGATSDAALLMPEISFSPDSLERPVVLEADLAIPSVSFSAADAENPSQFFDPIVSIDASYDGEATVEASGAVQVPEPAPVTFVVPGLAIIALFGMYHLNFKLHRHHHGRRRTVQIRELTVLR